MTKKVNIGMNSITEYEHFSKMREEKWSPPHSVIPPTSYSATNTNISLLCPLQKENWYESALGSFPTDLYLSVETFPNQPMAKASLFNRQHWFYYLLQIFWEHKRRISNRLDLHKNKSLQNSNRENKKKYLLGIYILI